MLGCRLVRRRFFFFFFFFVLVSVPIPARGSPPSAWVMLASDSDSESVSRVRSSSSGGGVGDLEYETVWRQPYARVWEAVSYYGDAGPRIVFNGGMTTSFYSFDPVLSSLVKLFDGESLPAGSSAGRMVAEVATNSLYVADVVGAGLIEYTLDGGALVGILTRSIWSLEGCSGEIGFMTLISPGYAGGVYVWNQGAGCIVKVIDVADASHAVVASGLSSDVNDVVEDSAGNLHVLHADGSIGMIALGGSSEGPRFGLQLGLGRVYYHQMVLLEERGAYVVTVPELGIVAAWSARDGTTFAVSPVRSFEPYSISNPAWSDDLLIVGGGSSLYAANASELLAGGCAKEDSSCWKDLLPTLDVPVPSLDRMYHVPQRLGGGFDFVVGSEVYSVRRASDDGNYHVVEVSGLGSLVGYADALDFFPGGECSRSKVLSQGTVAAYVAGRSNGDGTDAGGGDVLYSMNASMSTDSALLLYSTKSASVSITSLEHHPSFPMVCVGLSNGTLVCLDSSSGKRLVGFDLPSGDRVVSFAWSCSRDSELMVVGRDSVLHLELSSLDGKTLVLDEVQKIPTRDLSLGKIEQEPSGSYDYCAISGSSGGKAIYRTQRNLTDGSLFSDSLAIKFKLDMAALSFLFVDESDESSISDMEPLQRVQSPDVPPSWWDPSPGKGGASGDSGGDGGTGGEDGSDYDPETVVGDVSGNYSWLEASQKPATVALVVLLIGLMLFTVGYAVYKSSVGVGRRRVLLDEADPSANRILDGGESGDGGEDFSVRRVRFEEVKRERSFTQDWGSGESLVANPPPLPRYLLSSSSPPPSSSSSSRDAILESDSVDVSPEWKDDDPVGSKEWLRTCQGDDDGSRRQQQQQQQQLTRSFLVNESIMAPRLPRFRPEDIPVRAEMARNSGAGSPHSTVVIDGQTGSISVERPGSISSEEDEAVSTAPSKLTKRTGKIQDNV